MHSKHALARRNDLISRMFIETADKNYITARWAFFSGCDLDFYWSSSQAVEKYLKAVLLFNSHSAKGFGHNLVKLFGAIKKLDSDIDFGSLTQPSQLRGLVLWRDEEFASFINRINNFGNSHNRYMIYGYVLHGDELYKLDRVVWQLRRYCRPLRETVVRNGLNKPDIEINWVELLRRNTNSFQISGLLENLIRSKDKWESALRQTFLRHNFAFAPKSARRPLTERMAAAVSPFPPIFDALKDSNLQVEDRRLFYNILQWSFENIDFSDNDKKQITEALKQSKIA